MKALFLVVPAAAIAVALAASTATPRRWAAMSGSRMSVPVWVS
jgi:hypothetical protein